MALTFKEFMKMLSSSDESQPLTSINQLLFTRRLRKEHHRMFCNALLASPSSSLKQLHVSGHIKSEDDSRGVDGDIAACYARLLTATPSMDHLSFYCTNIGGEGFRLILQSLSSTNITHLSFSIDKTIGKEGMLHLVPTLPSISNLRSLTLKAVGMDAKGAALLAEALFTNTSLLSLNISWNELGDLGVEHIARMLQSNTTLQTLEMGWTNLSSSTAAKHLGIALEHNKTLLTFDISGTNSGIGEEEMELMFLNSHIITLVNNGFPRIFKAYANILLHNTTLTTLDLSGNMETEPSCIEELFKAIAQNRCLHSLSLRQCEAVRGHKILSCILDALRANSWLTHLDLEGTPLHDEGQTDVIEAQVKRIKEENLLGFPQMQKAEPKSIRVFFCGFPYAGKTTLKKSMIFASKGKLHSTLHSFSHGMFHSRTKRTRGIDIKCISYKGISISFWDLAGQEDYYSFHDFMFPNISYVGSPSLFFIVCNPMGTDGTKKPIEYIEWEVRYWLKFISSKAMPSEMFKPSVAIVFTHKDRWPHSNISSMHKLVHDLRIDFQAFLDLNHYAFDVNAKSPISSSRIFKYVRLTASSILKRCPRTYSCCNEASRLFNIWKGEHLCTPMIHMLDFIDLCNNVLELKETSTPCSVAASSLSNEQKLVAYTLNAIGDILYFPDLEYVVVDLKWFCKSIIGQMINCEDMTNQINVDERGFIGWVKFEEIVRKSFPNERDKRDVTRDATLIMQIMQKLNLCFTGITSKAMGHDIFIPANLKPADNQSWKLNIRSKVIKLGRRLQCLDQDHTILTPNFFPQIQVSLYNSFVEDHNIKCELLKDFVSIIYEEHAMEIHLVFHGPGIHDLLNSCSKDEMESECSPSYIDVLVQSPLDISKTLKRLQSTVIKKIRDFCASWRGCQGVALVEGILRPDCVEQPEKYKTKECVLLSTLQENLSKIPISEMHRNMYTWKEYYSSETRPADETKNLMGEEDFMHVMKKRMEGVQAVAAELEAKEEPHKEQPSSSAETPGGVLDRPLATNGSDMLFHEETFRKGGQQFAIEAAGISFESLRDFMNAKLGRLEEKVCQKVDMVGEMVGEKVDRVDEKVEELGKKLDRLICMEEKVVENLRAQIRALLDMVNEHRPAFEHRTPHLFYFTHKTVGMREKAAKLVSSLDCYQLRFYCEGLPPLLSSSSPSSSIGSMKHHKVEDGDHEGLLLYCSRSKRLQKAIPYLNQVLKLVTMVAKVGAHVVAGAGDLVPDLSRLPALLLDANVINAAVLKLEKLDPQVLQPGAALQNQSAEQWLVDILKENDCFSGKAIADSFGLYRVGHNNSTKVSWVCKSHKDHSDFHPLPLY